MMNPLIVVLIYLDFISVEKANGFAFECVTGAWGSKCQKKCGHCEGGEEFCQVYDGLCMNGCAAGYTGWDCKKKCEKGTHGQYCKYKCGHCSSVRPICDHESGKCTAGCALGYQEPYCKTPCPFSKWGERCRSKCHCGCGCDPATGECLQCGQGGLPEKIYRDVKVTTDCLHKTAADLSIVLEHVTLNAKDFPIKPVLSGIGIILLFMFGNYFWWFLLVRKPKPKKVPVSIDRPKARPDKVKQKPTVTVVAANMKKEARLRNLQSVLEGRATKK